ncbi:MAG: YebC/PmpR family DNA-binding transcriptional regulator [Firmicutes bacterium]|nr:YebC/PmpR family DNA-binding transcriptional regulator [Bacillota bacterium]
MAGHSKWSNIKHAKGRADAARSKLFARITKEIILAAKDGGPNPDYNVKLKQAIAKAKDNNMPNDNINRAILRGSGQLEGVNYEELLYEGYGPGGIAIMVEVITDNRNRTAGEMRHIFDKYGGNLGETGSVGWMFQRKGVLVIDKEEYPELTEDEIMLDALEAGAEDLVDDEEVFEIYTGQGDFDQVREVLAEKYKFLVAEISNIPDNTLEVEEENLDMLKKLLFFLNDNDDVQNVYDNAEYEDDDEE